MKENILKEELVELNFYAVRSQDGKWLGSKGRWTNDMTKIKISANSRSPKSQITWWSNHYPEYGIPYLVKITKGYCQYIDQNDRVGDVNFKKKRAQLQRDLNNNLYKKKMFEADEQFKKINRQLEIEKLNKRINDIEFEINKLYKENAIIGNKS